MNLSIFIEFFRNSRGGLRDAPVRSRGAPGITGEPDRLIVSSRSVTTLGAGPEIAWNLLRLSRMILDTLPFAGCVASLPACKPGRFTRRGPWCILGERADSARRATAGKCARGGTDRGGVQKNLSGDRRDRPLCLSETLTKDNHGGLSLWGPCRAPNNHSPLEGRASRGESPTKRPSVFCEGRFGGG